MSRNADGKQIAMDHFHIYSECIHSMAISGAAFSAFFCVEDSTGHGGFPIFLSRGEQAVRKKIRRPLITTFSPLKKRPELTEAGHF